MMLSVIVTTYEWPEALDAVLRALSSQSDPDFEIVVADDGSGAATDETVNRWKADLGTRLTHVWQADEGFRLARVRNLGATAARGKHLAFIDGDCIPRRHFVAAIRRALLPGWFLAGKRMELGPVLSRRVLTRRWDVASWSTGELLLRSRGRLRPFVYLTARDRRRPWRPGLPDFVPDGNTYGFLTCVFRSDFERVDGFDNRFVGWGDQDVDLAVRLKRLGLRCSYAGPRATMLHLWHEEHADPERPTWWQLTETVESERVEALEGLTTIGSAQSRRTPDSR